MSGALSTAKPACSTCGLCSRAPMPRISPSIAPPSLRLSLICAVVLMSSRARCTCASWCADVHAADLVGLVLLVGEPARGAAGGAALAQREHAGAARIGRGEGIGMDAHEQVGLHAPRLLHAHAQRHEEVGVAREEGAHRVAVDAAGVDAVAQPVRDLQHDVLLARAVGADGAGVFAAVAGIERDDDDAVGAAGRGAPRCCCCRAAAPRPMAAAGASPAAVPTTGGGGRARPARGRTRRRRTGRGAHRLLRHQLAQRIGRTRRRPAARAATMPAALRGAMSGCCCRCPRLGRIAQALGDQRLHRVDRPAADRGRAPAGAGRPPPARARTPAAPPPASGRTRCAPRSARTARRAGR